MPRRRGSEARLACIYPAGAVDYAVCQCGAHKTLEIFRIGRIFPRSFSSYELISMPIYEYECKDCGHQFETIRKISDGPPDACPSCGTNALQKLVSKAAFRLKGTGWYETDFKNKKSDKKSGDAGDAASKDTKSTASDSGESAKSSSDSSAKSEAKPAAASND